MAGIQPSNNSELQLYRVLQRANLLQYFETFITQGGDDVQQLCEAGEDEFLEIMALVGMASKPLHVRRLQKALQEWVANPAAFEGKVVKKYPTHVMSMVGSTSQAVSPSHSLERSNSGSGGNQDYKVTPPQSSAISTSTPWASQTGARGVSPSEGSNLEQPSPSDSPQGDFKDALYNQDDPAYAGMNLSQPILLEHQITAIANAAALLAQELPTLEPKTLPKKAVSKEITAVMMMLPDDPNRMDALRKYAAIYGRFDSKRKNDRPMSLHEISVNEAAAQLCSHIPALLTRREELFPFARQVVRGSGYQYSKGHSRAAEVLVMPKLEEGEAPPSHIAMASNSPLPLPVAIAHDDNFNELQMELTQITMDLSEMNKEQDRIRSALRVLLEAKDHDQMKSLTKEMDNLNDQQSVLVKRRQMVVNAISKYRKGGPTKNAQQLGAPSFPSTKHTSRGHPSMKSNNNNSNNNGSSNSNKFNNSFFSDNGLPNSGNPLNTLYAAAMQNHKDSLFEEGLRIATQYGMSDFAQELIGMKSKDKLDDVVEPGVRVSEGRTSSAFNAYSSSPSASAHFSSPFSSAVDISSALTTIPSCFSSSNGRLNQSSPLSSTLPFVTTGAMNAPKNSLTLAANMKSHNQHGSRLHNITATCTSAASHFNSNNNSSINNNNNNNIINNNNSKSGNTKSNRTSNGEHTDTSISKVNNNNNVDDKNKSPISTGESTVAQGSTTTTTTITTKSGQVIEVETRRSSRRKNGEPDYYLINGGEKRFRSSSSRRSSSTSSERARRLSSSSSTSSVAPSTPTATTPTKQQQQQQRDSSINRDSSGHNGDMVQRDGHASDSRSHVSNAKQLIDHQEDSNSEIIDDDQEYGTGESEKRNMRRKTKVHSYTGQRLITGEFGH